MNTTFVSYYSQRAYIHTQRGKSAKHERVPPRRHSRDPYARSNAHYFSRDASHDPRSKSLKLTGPEHTNGYTRTAGRAVRDKGTGTSFVVSTDDRCACARACARAYNNARICTRPKRPPARKFVRHAVTSGWSYCAFSKYDVVRAPYTKRLASIDLPFTWR